MAGFSSGAGCALGCLIQILTNLFRVSKEEIKNSVSVAACFTWRPKSLESCFLGVIFIICSFCFLVVQNMAKRMCLIIPDFVRGGAMDVCFGTKCHRLSPPTSDIDLAIKSHFCPDKELTQLA